jgi:hypothetical protein
MELLRSSNPIARRDYACDACVWLFESNYRYGLTISEYRSIVKAKRNDFKIKAGSKYVYQCCKNYGDFYVFRAIPEIHAICLKYDMYDCD